MNDTSRYSFYFKRRRYGLTTFTRAWVEHNGKLLSLGRTWPCRDPNPVELEIAAERAIENYERQK